MNADILIVEDDEEESTMMEEIFRENGYTKIASFNNALSFLSYLDNEGSHLPKVVILDYNMPKISGFQLLAYLKHTERLSGISVIMYSGFDGDDYKIKCIKAGVTDYIKKLTTPGELKEFTLRVKEFVETGIYKKISL